MKTLTSTRRFHATTFLGGFNPGRIWTAFQVARERRALAGLDSRALADLGLSEAAARREAGRSFWDIPAGR